MAPRPRWEAGTAAERAFAHITDYLAGLPERPVGAAEGYAKIHARLSLPLPAGSTDPLEIVDELAAAAEPGLAATGSPRFFGYVIGGTVPAALAADLMAVAWDQNAGLARLSPAAAAAEAVAGVWIKELLGLPATASVGITTGTQMAHVTALGAARHRALARYGWDVEADGLHGAPPVRVFVGAARHTTVDAALRLLGFGSRRLTVVDTDDAGRMRPEALRVALAAGTGPAIVVAQAGEINTGAFDAMGQICAISHEHGAWVHVDGAFGLWAAVSASARRRALVAGIDQADSWATDGHKWLNLAYDCGIAIVADERAHRAAMSTRAPYIPPPAVDEHDPLEWTPEFSRRARGFALYAALRSLGRAGLTDLVDRCCAHARRLADALGALDGVAVLNDVELNQVLVRIDDDDATTAAVIELVVTGGEALVSGTVWHHAVAMRLSVCNWMTTEADVDRAVAAIAAAIADARGRCHA
ncbi:aspartate aminotransferase family protein [Frankia sp. CcI49]|uniref:pyridoxal phosphate-dependent decarboxylase family protein n=1 Tax=unclassified Frankia TaxID=2632575 RepID=UPI0006CA5D42|nr:MULTISPECIES: pyridoxal-dependent decarboxylase [unclassified Frankia]KPM55073.1 pyridoxal-dependent decarboxylase [Frankia sp. R43]ONH56232.1 aspartate aminotransferase family protein [Frankia sp. CcI49]